MPTITYLCGPPGCGKTRAVRDRCLQAMRDHGPDSVILLLPDAATVAAAQDDLVAHTGGLYDARLLTFPALAQALLKGNHDPIAPLEPPQRFLLARRIATDPKIGLPAALTRHTGFIRGLCDFTDELKRAAVEPDAFTQAIRRLFRGDDRAAGLARFYAEYQRQLTVRNLYDEAGLFWRATDLLSQGRDRPFHEARLVLVDGFTDFTTTQLQVLRSLAGDERDLLVTLTLPPDEDRRDDFAAAWNVLARLQQHLGAGDVRWLTECDSRPAPLRHLLDHLFRLEPPPPVPADQAISLLAAPGILGEVREILRDVKTLLLDGTPPGDICLIFPALDLYRRPLQDLAREVGVPLAVLGGEPLAARPSVQAVLDLLQIPRHDYAPRDVVQLLKSNFVDPAALQAPDAPLTPEDFEAVVYEARVMGGRQNWADQFRLYGDRLQAELRLAREGMALDEESEPRDPADIEADRERLRRAGNLFNALTRRLDRFRDPLTRREHVRRLLQLVEELGLPSRVGASVPEAQAIHDTAANLAAFSALTQALRQIADADQLLADAETVSFADFSAEIIALCADTIFDLPPAREGRVLALDAYRARQLRRPVAFIGGLVEGQWPAARHERAFFDDRERRRLQAAGLQLDLSADLQQDETYLFYLACAVPEQRLVLSHPTMDSKGEALLRSHYVDEVARLFAPGTLPERERRLSDSVPAAADIVCLRELLEHVVQRDDLPLLHALRDALPDDLRRRADHALAMAAVEQQRYAFAPFETHDGVLADPAIHARLAARFGADHRWSASALGQFGNCPFRFFVERVLHLQALELPTEEAEASDLGRLAHTILSRFFRAHQAAHPDEPVAVQNPADARQHMAKLAHQAFADWLTQGLVTHRKLWALAEERLTADLLALVSFEHESLRDTGLVPRAFETSYDLRVTPPDAAEPLRLGGKIDRVDVQPHPPPGAPQQYAVYDYKGGGGPSPNAIEKGQDFQMPFYALGAAQAVLGGAALQPAHRPQCAGWAYYKYRRPPELSRKVGANKRYLQPDEYVDLALQWAARHVQAIRAGRFAVAPAACDYCDFDGICRHAPWRSRAKAEGGVADEA
jgi:ATP-dependent helicase/DNAse subunit B